jgi:mannose-6-phosphate isomerase-like protein (cupin superfamily)
MLLCTIALAGGCWSAMSAQQGEGKAQEAVSYAPKPTRLIPYTPPQKPHTRLQDVKAKHKGQAEWSEWVIKDDYLWTQYIQSAPGSKVSPRFHPDNREWWVILEGEIRFQIEGQEPFVARRRSMVQVPTQTIYSMETVGEKPAIRYEVNIHNVSTLFTEPPRTHAPGIEFIPIRLGRHPFPYVDNNKPHINLDDLAAGNPNYSGGRFVNDDRAGCTIIYGYNSKLPPVNDKDRGHFHPDNAESWVILQGLMRYKIEGQEVFVASEGDVVYVPKFTFHSARWWGDGPSCRLSMHGYPHNLAHLRDP